MTSQFAALESEADFEYLLELGITRGMPLSKQWEWCYYVTTSHYNGSEQETARAIRYRAFINVYNALLTQCIICGGMGHGEANCPTKERISGAYPMTTIGRSMHNHVMDRMKNDCQLATNHQSRNSAGLHQKFRG